MRTTRVLVVLVRRVSASLSRGVSVTLVLLLQGSVTKRTTSVVVRANRRGPLPQPGRVKYGISQAARAFAFEAAVVSPQKSQVRRGRGNAPFKGVVRWGPNGVQIVATAAQTTPEKSVVRKGRGPWPQPGHVIINPNWRQQAIAASLVGPQKSIVIHPPWRKLNKGAAAYTHVGGDVLVFPPDLPIPSRIIRGRATQKTQGHVIAAPNARQLYAVTPAAVVISAMRSMVIRARPGVLTRGRVVHGPSQSVIAAIQELLRAGGGHGVFMDFDAHWNRFKDEKIDHFKNRFENKPRRRLK